MLTIIKYLTSGNVNFKVCNNTGSSHNTRRGHAELAGGPMTKRLLIIAAFAYPQCDCNADIPTSTAALPTWTVPSDWNNAAGYG